MNVFRSDEAERAALGIFLTREESQKNIGYLLSSDFSNPVYRKLFEAVQTLYADKRQIDIVTVCDQLQKMFGAQESILSSQLFEIVNDSFVGAWALEGHIKIIKDAAMRRQLMEILQKAEKDLSDEGIETGLILEKTRQELRDIVATPHKWKSMADVLIETNQALEDRASGKEAAMPSGVQTIDRFTSGFHRGELTIIGARPSVGKSAFGAHIALSTSENGYKVGICSREMTAVQYGTRIISRGAEVDSSRLRSGKLDDEDWYQIAQALGLYGSMNVSFVFSTRYIEDLRMEVQSKADAGELDMLVVDYVQLMQSKQRFDKDYLRIGYVSKMLKDMSVDCNISVIALAQVGRASEGTMPTLAELRGSGDLEQDADNVVFLHRPADDSDRYVRPSDRMLFSALQSQGMQYMAVNIAKQRQGETGTVSVVFNPRRMIFTPIDRTRSS